MRSIVLAIFLVGCAATPPMASNDAGTTQDASLADADASPGDAAGDTSPPVDAGDASTPKPIVCGQTVCRADQTCSAGKCAFACTGSTVPGDYATVQAAIDGLATAGKDATICLADANYPEPQVFVRDSGTHGKALTIVGLSMDRSKISGSLYWFGGWGSVTFQGVHIAAASNAVAFQVDFGNHPNGKVSLVATRVSGQNGLVAGTGFATSGEIFVDGCDFGLAGGDAVEAYVGGDTGSIKATVRNSYMHGCGTATHAGSPGQGSVDLSFVGNTVVGGYMGLQLAVGTNVKVLYANNVFTGLTAEAIQRTGTGVNDVHHHNALWGNAANYSGTADGAAYVKADCLLDLTGPAPTLKPGSPCRNAGDSAPATDFFAALRSIPPDIGAVEAP